MPWATGLFPLSAWPIPGIGGIPDGYPFPGYIRDIGDLGLLKEIFSRWSAKSSIIGSIIGE